MMNILIKYLPLNARMYKDVYNEKNTIVVGRKTMPWWERIYYNENGKAIMYMLRIGHPERKKEKEYVNMVSNWIKSCFEDQGVYPED